MASLMSARRSGCLRSTLIHDLLEHLPGVSFTKWNAPGGVGHHFGQPLANFAFLRASQDGGLLDFVPLFIEPAREGPPLGQRQRQHLGFKLFHAHA